MKVQKAEETEGMWFAITTTNQIEKVFFSEEKAQAYVKHKINTALDKDKYTVKKSK